MLQTRQRSISACEISELPRRHVSDGAASAARLAEDFGPLMQDCRPGTAREKFELGQRDFLAVEEMNDAVIVARHDPRTMT